MNPVINLQIDTDLILRAMQPYIGTHTVNEADVLNDRFMSVYTKYASFPALLDAGGFHEDDVRTRQFQKFLFDNTRFYDFDDLLKIASTVYFMVRVADGQRMEHLLGA